MLWGVEINVKRWVCYLRSKLCPIYHINGGYVLCNPASGEIHMCDTKSYGVAKATRILEVRSFFDFEGTLVDFQWQLKPSVEKCLTALAAV